MLARFSATAAAAVLLTLATIAPSSATTLFAMDTDAVLNNSAVGVHIRERLSAIGDEITAELTAQEASVRGAVEEFNTATADLTE